MTNSGQLTPNYSFDPDRAHSVSSVFSCSIYEPPPVLSRGIPAPQIRATRWICAVLLRPRLRALPVVRRWLGRVVGRVLHLGQRRIRAGAAVNAIPEVGTLVSFDAYSACPRLWNLTALR